jgi:hypothetical protein
MTFYYNDIKMNIRYRRCFIEREPSLPGYQRFFSADRQFPISVAYPDRLGAFYDYNRSYDLAVEFPDDLVIRRKDLRLLAQRDDRNAAEVVSGRRDATWYLREDMENRKHASRDRQFAGVFNVRQYQVKDRDRDLVAVGSPPTRVPRITWETLDGNSGEWVFFLLRDMGLWMIIRMPGGLIHVEFQTVLASFRFLTEDFFLALPVQPEI